LWPRKLTLSVEQKIKNDPRKLIVDSVQASLPAGNPPPNKRHTDPQIVSDQNDLCWWCGTALPPNRGWCTHCEHFGRSFKSCKHCRAPLVFGVKANNNKKAAKWCQECEKGQGWLSWISISSQSATAVATLVAALIGLCIVVKQNFSSFFVPAEVGVAYDSFDTKNSRLSLIVYNDGERPSVVKIRRLKVSVRADSDAKLASRPCTNASANAQKIYASMQKDGQAVCVELQATAWVNKDSSHLIHVDIPQNLAETLTDATRNMLTKSEYTCWVQYTATGTETFFETLLHGASRETSNDETSMQTQPVQRLETSLCERLFNRSVQ
jgi:hypothetical protein